MSFLLRSTRAGVAAAASVVCVAALVSCSDGDGGSSSPSTTPAPSATGSPASPSPSGNNRTTITIRDFAFHPATLTVAPGSTITVINSDSVTHNVTAGSTFTSGDVGAGKTVTFTAPSTAGTYRYICTIHPFMKGSLTVR